MNNVEIDILNIHKKFKDTYALKGVSMHFQTGKLYGIIGPAGAGKTTLFRLILQLLKPNSCSSSVFLTSVNNNSILPVTQTKTLGFSFPYFFR